MKVYLLYTFADAGHTLLGVFSKEATAREHGNALSRGFWIETYALDRFVEEG